MSTQIQRRRGTTAEHSTFTGVEGELTVDTTKDTAVVHDGTTVGGHPLQKQYPPLGSAAAPTYTFTGDTNTGIYSPGADQVAVATNGTGRLFVDASGRVGVGTASPTADGLHIVHSTQPDLFIGTSTNAEGFKIVYNDTDTSIGNVTNTPLRVVVGNSEKARITSAGLVGIGTSSPTGKLDVTGTLGTIRVQGSGANLEFTRDGGNTFLASGTNGEFYFQTGGTNTRMFISKTGKVGIGTASPGAQLEINGGVSRTDYWTPAGKYSARLGLVTGTDTDVYAGITGSYLNGTSANLILQARYSDFGTTSGVVLKNSSSNAGGLAICSLTATSGGAVETERARITSAGKVGIGTSSPSQALHVVTSTAYQGIFVNGNQAPNVSFNIGSNATAKWKAGISGNNADAFSISAGVANDDKLFINASGNVGIGTTSPAHRLHVSGGSLCVDGFANSASNYITLRSGYAPDAAGGSGIKAVNHAAGNDDGLGLFGHDGLSFYTAQTERVRIDSSGRLLVGTSSARSNFYGSTAPRLQVEGNSYAESTLSLFRAENLNTSVPALLLGKSRSSSVGGSTAVQSGDGLGQIDFLGADGTSIHPAARILAEVDATPGTNDMPGRLVFSTTADGASSPTERMRIDNLGSKFNYGTDNHVFFSNTGKGSNTSDSIFYGRHSATGTTNGTICVIIRSNGQIENINGVYGTFSDLKLKENITDAQSQWDDIKKLKVVNYNYRPETNYDQHTQLGVIAQDVEQISPGLVSESTDRDKDGNDLGTVTKSVKYSVLYMKAVKALQETMERIETLEGMVAVNNITIDEQQHQLSTLAARLTALESA
jgi:hypothetical protein